MLVALIGERIGMQHTSTPLSSLRSRAIFLIAVEPIAPDTGSRDIAPTAVWTEVRGIKRPVSSTYPTLLDVPFIRTRDEEPAYDLIRCILMIIPEGLRDELLDIPDEVLPEIDCRSLDIAHIGVFNIGAYACKEDRREAVDRLMIATHRAACDGCERVVTEEQ